MAADDKSEDDKTRADDASQETAVGRQALDPDAGNQPTSVSNPVVDSYGDTSETSAIPAATVSSSEGEQSPADAQREAEGKPPAPPTAPLHGAPPSDDTPAGTGPGGEVRGGYGSGGTGPDGDVRGPAETGTASPAGGLSPADAQRRAEDSGDAFDANPHFFVLGAFVGGLVFAQVLKRFGGGND